MPLEPRRSPRRRKRTVGPKTSVTLYSPAFSALPETRRDALLREHDAALKRLQTARETGVEIDKAIHTFSESHEKIFGEKINIDGLTQLMSRKIIQKKGEFSKDYAELTPAKRTSVWNRVTELFRLMELQKASLIEREEHDALFLFINGEVFGSTFRIRNFLDRKDLTESDKQAVLKDLMDLGFKLFFEIGYNKTELDEYKSGLHP